MALFTNQTAPTGGIPSLTTDQIVQLYQYYLHRPPDSTELASEQENALKYSAAGIERQIANRAGNTAGSGIRGDEGQPALTRPAPSPAPQTIDPGVVLHVITDAAPTAAVATPMPTGSNGVPSTPTFQPTAVNAAPVVPSLYNPGGTGGPSYGSTSVTVGGGDSGGAQPSGAAAGGFGGLSPTMIMVGAAAIAAFLLLRGKG